MAILTNLFFAKGELPESGPGHLWTLNQKQALALPPSIEPKTVKSQVKIVNEPVQTSNLCNHKYKPPYEEQFDGVIKSKLWSPDPATLPGSGIQKKG